MDNPDLTCYEETISSDFDSDSTPIDFQTKNDEDDDNMDWLFKELEDQPDYSTGILPKENIITSFCVVEQDVCPMDMQEMVKHPLSNNSSFSQVSMFKTKVDEWNATYSFLQELKQYEFCPKKDSLSFRNRELVYMMLCKLAQKLRMKFLTVGVAMELLEKYLSLFPQTHHLIRLIMCACFYIAYSVHEVYCEYDHLDGRRITKVLHNSIGTIYPEMQAFARQNIKDETLDVLNSAQLLNKTIMIITCDLQGNLAFPKLCLCVENMSCSLVPIWEQNEYAFLAKLIMICIQFGEMEVYTLKTKIVSMYAILDYKFGLKERCMTLKLVEFLGVEKDRDVLPCVKTMLEHLHDVYIYSMDDDSDDSDSEAND